MVKLKTVPHCNVLKVKSYFRAVIDISVGYDQGIPEMQVVFSCFQLYPGNVGCLYSTRGKLASLQNINDQSAILQLKQRKSGSGFYQNLLSILQISTVAISTVFDIKQK